MDNLDNLIIKRSNQALNVNPPSQYIDIHITSHGSDWLWTCYAIFSLFTVLHAGLFLFTSSKKAPLKKTILTIPFFINIVLAFAYFTYASNLGYTGIPTQFHHVTTSVGYNVRQIFYSKFIAWFVAWPMVMALYEINLTSVYKKETAELAEEHVGEDGHATVETGDLFQKLLNFLQGYFSKFLTAEIWVLGLLVGALIQSSYKWGYFTFAAFSQLVAISLLFKGIASSLTTKGSSLKKFGHFLIGFQIIVWLLQTVNWGLSEGGNRIQPDSEAAWTGVLDLITFAFIPTALTFINIKSLDEDFFHKLSYNNSHFSNIASGLRRHSRTEKITETPRHSGDTAVPNVATPPIDETYRDVNISEPIANDTVGEARV